MKNRQMEWPKIVLLTYIICVMIVAAFMMKNSRKDTVSRLQFGTGMDKEIILLDSKIIEMSFIVPESELVGFAIGYDANNLQFEDEYIEFGIFNQSLNLVQNEKIKLVEQKSNKEIYFNFASEIEKGELLTIVIKSRGLTNNGPKIWTSTNRVAFSNLKINGDLKRTRNLYASLLFKKSQNDAAKVVASGLIAVVLGFFLLFIYRTEKIPFIIRKKRKLHQKKSIVSGGKMAILKAMIELVIILGVLFTILDYTYIFAVKKPANQNAYCILNECVSNTVDIPLRAEAVLNQKIICPTETFSGIGFCVGSVKSKNGTLNVEVFDPARNELLTKATVKLSELESLNDVLEGQLNNSYEKEIIDRIKGVTFESILHGVENKILDVRFSIAESKNAEIVLLANEKDVEQLCGTQIFGGQLGYNLCCMSLYKPSLFLKKMYLIFAIFSLVIIFIAYYFVFWRLNENIESIYIKVAFALGFVFMLLITIYGVPDETAHIDTVYRLSNRMLGISEAQGPNQMYKRISDIDIYDINKVDVTIDSWRDLSKTLFEKCENPELKATYGENTLGNSTLLNFLPAAIGFTLARIMNWGYTPMVLLGRLFNILTAGLMIYFAIKRAPFAKNVFAVAGLLPITLQQIASCSYDAVLIGAAFMFCSYCLALMFEPYDICLLDYIIMFLNAIIILSCKGGVYLPIVCVSLLIPLVRWKGKGKNINRRKAIAILGIFSLILLCFVRQYATKIFGIFSTTQGTTFGRVENVELYSMSYFISRPLELIRIFENTFVALGDYHFRQIVGGLLGRLNINVSWIIVIGFIILLILASLRSQEEQQILKKWHKCFIGIMCFSCLLLIYLSMLVSWTPFGDLAILGIQGRYFLPFLVFAVLLFRNTKLIFECETKQRFLFIACMLDICVFSQIILAVL